MPERQVKVRLLSDDRLIPINWPTDEQWIERFRTRKIIQKDIGRGQLTTEVLPNDSHDHLLLGKLAGGENSFEPGDATLVLNTLSEAAVEDIQQDGAAFLVTIRTALGRLEVKAAKPTAKQILDYRKKFVRPIEIGRGRTELRTDYKAAGDLFDLIAPEAAGWSIIHKIPVVAAIIAEIDELLAAANEGFTTGS